MKKFLIIVFSIVFLIEVVIVHYVLIDNFLYQKEVDQFPIRICNNLIESNYINDRSECFYPLDVPLVMEAMFPNGTSIDYVMKGLEGFKQTEHYSHIVESENSSCDVGAEIITLQYLIIGETFNGGWKYYDFIFCDGILIGTRYHN